MLLAAGIVEPCRNAALAACPSLPDLRAPCAFIHGGSSSLLRAAGNRPDPDRTSSPRRSPFHRWFAAHFPPSSSGWDYVGSCPNDRARWLGVYPFLLVS